MAVSEYYVDPGGGNDTTGNGTVGTPWATVQKALNTITRNSTDGDRINVKAGTADVLTAALSLSTYGTPAIGAWLIIQGYTSTAGDGGIGAISGNSGNFAIMDLNAVSKSYVCFVDLKMGNTGTATVLKLYSNSSCLNCELHTSSNAEGVYVSTGGNMLVGCWFHDLTGATGLSDGGTATRVINCFFDSANTTRAVFFSGTSGIAIGNIIRYTGADTSVYGIYASTTGHTIYGNTLYVSNANTDCGIYAGSAAIVVMNNIVEGWSGSGGDGIEQANRLGFVGANAIYNCTNAVTTVAAKGNIAIAPNDTLGASPFVDKANGNFAINGTVTGVTEDAIPGAFRGLATTTSKADKGAVQAGAGSGGAGGLLIPHGMTGGING